MKRSVVNDIPRENSVVIRPLGNKMAVAGHMTQGALTQNGWRIICDRRVGRDETGRGGDKFDGISSFLFTKREGLMNELKRGGGLPDAETKMRVHHGSDSPKHVPVVKTKDTVNRVDKLLCASADSCLWN